MEPIKQTVLHDPDNGKIGNCLSASLATLLHLHIEDVPLFSHNSAWIQDLNQWLQQFNLAYVLLYDFDDYCRTHGIIGCHHEISGHTDRGNEVTHSCVAVDGEVVFDPHPSDSGLDHILDSGIFVALRPWEFLK